MVKLDVATGDVLPNSSRENAVTWYLPSGKVFRLTFAVQVNWLNPVGVRGAVRATFDTTKFPALFR